MFWFFNDYVLKSDDLDVSNKCGDVFDKSNEPVTSKYLLSKPVTQSEPCTCTCRKSKEFNKDTKSGKNGTSFYMKNQTCFNCGIPGHIA